VNSEQTPRDRVLGLLQGGEVDRIACYSGMGNVTTAGLDRLGYRFTELHSDPVKMAAAALTSHELFGYECAVVPYDLCVEAEALGCQMNPYSQVEHLLYPTIKEKAIHDVEEMTKIEVPSDLGNRGRVPVVTEAIRILKRQAGEFLPVGTYCLGPFTLAGQLMDLNDLFKQTFKNQKGVGIMLDILADLVIELAEVYRQAGADYICIREMGATTDVLSPRVFRSLIRPPLEKIFRAISYPKILHICGNSNAVVKDMVECGADAIAVEQRNDLVKTRQDVGEEPLVFGNIDAYHVLVNGKPEDVEQVVLASIERGVDALWPGCDIWPTASVENLRAMVETVKRYGSQRWRRKQAVQRDMASYS